MFQKSLRLKNVKSVQKSATTHPSDPIDLNDSSYNVEGSSTEEVDQGVINLIGTDAPRIAEFAANQYIFVNIVVTFTVAIVVLVRLIGWISLGVGLLAPVFLLPLNMLASQRYAQAQGGLMKDRDAKIRVVTEALQAIRQIKFTASELRWQEKIMEQRDAELGKQKTVFIWTIVLRFFWMASPIILSVLALATYAWIHGTLSASVAFTALAVFGNLEFALSLIPQGIIIALDALVSCKRIENHVYAPERIGNRLDGDNIKFVMAEISWPRDMRGTDSSFFQLKGVSAEFPNGKLRYYEPKT